MTKDLRTIEEKTLDIENAIEEIHEYLLHKDNKRLGQRIKSNIVFMTDRIGEIQSRNIELRQLLEEKFSTVYILMMVQTLTALALIITLLFK
tara:strand:- start:138 stop:413 length:276 start_codon:yes stop_codon:yes gene_type:complete